jgi:hypothetical protein
LLFQVAKGINQPVSAIYKDNIWNITLRRHPNTQVLQQWLSIMQSLSQTKLTDEQDHLIWKFLSYSNFLYLFATRLLSPTRCFVAY